MALLFPPAAEHRNCIEYAAMVGAAATMILEQGFDGARVKIAGLGRSGRAPGVAREIIETADEPVGERHLEAELSAFEPVVRQPRFDRAPEHMLADSIIQLEIGGNSQRPINEIVRQERYPSLERVGHGRTVEPLQQ